MKPDCSGTVMSALELVLAESGFKLEVGAGVAAFQKAYAAAK